MHANNKSVRGQEWVGNERIVLMSREAYLKVMEGIIPVETGNRMNIGTQILDSLWSNPYAGVILGEICDLGIESWHFNDFLNFIHTCSPFNWFVGECLMTVFDFALASCEHLFE